MSSDFSQGFIHTYTSIVSQVMFITSQCIAMPATNYDSDTLIWSSHRSGTTKLHKYISPRFCLKKWADMHENMLLYLSDRGCKLRTPCVVSARHHRRPVLLHAFPHAFIFPLLSHDASLMSLVSLKTSNESTLFSHHVFWIKLLARLVGQVVKV